jgi:ElaA protein
VLEIGGFPIVNCGVLWFEKTWGEMTPMEMFAALRLRSEVFVVEQDCVYPDLDDKDVSSIHLGALADEAAPGESARAVVRLVPPGVSYAEPSIGRVAIDAGDRGSGLGVELMERAIRCCERHWPGMGIRISAQQYLIGFYNRLGFSAVGEGYDEDGIPHIQMYLAPRGLSHWKAEWKDARKSFCEELNALPFAQLNGTKEHWGGLQVLEHLRLSEAGIWGYLNKKRQANPLDLPNSTLESDGRGWSLIKALQSNARWKDPTPGARLTPGQVQSHDLHQLQSEWEQEQDQAFDLLADAFESDCWWQVQVFNHPIAGRISLSDTFGFGVAHVQHHIHQLRRLTRSIPEDAS